MITEKDGAITYCPSAKPFYCRAVIAAIAVPVIFAFSAGAVQRFLPAWVRWGAAVLLTFIFEWQVLHRFMHRGLYRVVLYPNRIEWPQGFEKVFLQISEIAKAKESIDGDIELYLVNSGLLRINNMLFDNSSEVDKFLEELNKRMKA